MAKSSTSLKTTRGSKPSPTTGLPPEIILDFVFDNGLFFISVRNISERPAYKVSVKFDRKIVGLGGTKEISALPLFQNIEFLAPGREIRTFLDSSDSYFLRKQPTKLKVQISYRDFAEEKHSVSIFHDLEIYRELPFIGNSKDVATVTDGVTNEGE